MWVDVEQNTDEWLELRKGKATSSNFSKIMAHDGKAFGDPAKKYAEKIALEIVTDRIDETENYSNKYMERGNSLEPYAIREYEKETFKQVLKGGFYYKKNIGDSPDGRILNNGSLECKSVIASTQWKRLKEGGIDPAYKWQIHGHIWIGDKEWCDFVSYCPEMPKDKQCYIHRVFRDEEIITKMSKRINLFFEEVDKNIELLKYSSIDL